MMTIGQLGHQAIWERPPAQPQSASAQAVTPRLRLSASSAAASPRALAHVDPQVDGSPASALQALPVLTSGLHPPRSGPGGGGAAGEPQAVERDAFVTLARRFVTGWETPTPRLHAEDVRRILREPAAATYAPALFIWLFGPEHASALQAEPGAREVIFADVFCRGSDAWLKHLLLMLKADRCTTRAYLQLMRERAARSAGTALPQQLPVRQPSSLVYAAQSSDGRQVAILQEAYDSIQPGVEPGFSVYMGQRDQLQLVPLRERPQRLAEPGAWFFSTERGHLLIETSPWRPRPAATIMPALRRGLGAQDPEWQRTAQAIRPDPAFEALLHIDGRENVLKPLGEPAMLLERIDVYRGNHDPLLPSLDVADSGLSWRLAPHPSRFTLARA